AVIPGRVGLVVLAIALTALACGAGAMCFRKPKLVFENRLADIVTVQVSGEERRILPGGSFTLKLDRSRRLDLSCQLVSRLGVSLGDTIAVSTPRVALRIAATAPPTRGSYFAPLSTKHTVAA